MENHLQKFFQFPLNLDKLTLNVSVDGQNMDSSSRTLEKLDKDSKTKGSVKQVLLDGCLPFSHQVAGHKCGINNTDVFLAAIKAFTLKIVSSCHDDKVPAGFQCLVHYNYTGVLQHPDGTILKQLQPPPRGPREMHFYTQVYAKDCTDTRLQDLQQHLPKFYGTWAPRESPHDLYLKLEDVTKRFLRPCIMDVKIGRRSYDPFASQEKRKEQISKYPLMEEIGFLVLGMRVYQINSDSYITHDQFYGRSLGKDTVKNGLSRFFHNGQDLQRHAVSLIISKIRSILRWFESQTQLHFYASSLLLVYEGSPRAVNGWKHKRTGHQQGEPQSNCNKPHEALSVQGSLTHTHPYCCETNANGMCAGSVEEEQKEIGIVEKKRFGQEEAVEVKMIDFAHVFPSNSPDEGYMYGLRNLLSTLEQILKD